MTRAAATSPKLPDGRRLRVAVVGGGPAGGAAAEALAKGGVETVLIERKLDNCKPCGGAIPLCMVSEFDLPLDLVDRKVRKMKMISPSNVAVDIGRTLAPHEYIGMVRREVLDDYLRTRAKSAGAEVVNGLFLRYIVDHLA
jgi:geranylgeranyl diphosphate/geranylgeranyl-bacteriochlorophyllide a reductase